MYFYLEEINIHKIRHLSDLVIPIGGKPFNNLIITGKNGSGKTSLLEALKLHLYLLMRDSVSRERIINSLDKPILSHVKDLGELPQPKSFEMFISHHPIPGREIPDTTGVSLKFTGGKEPEHLDANGGFVVAYFGAQREYSVANPQHVEKVNLSDKYDLLDRPGDEFVKYLLDFKTQEAMYRSNGNVEKADQLQSWIDRVEKILQIIFEDAGLCLEFNIETFAFFIREQGKEAFSFSELSSGYAAILDIVTDLMLRMEKYRGTLYDVPGIVMIDEVDVHLHLSLQKSIMPILTQMFPKIQFIVTTHSPYVVGSVENAINYDLERQEAIENLSGYSADELAEMYFDVGAYSKTIVEKLKRYAYLVEKNNLTDDERAERAALHQKLQEADSKVATSEIRAEFRAI